ncbi:contactin-5-like isoform X1 [Tachypleus tridentatus]|uniref:contactin-5-like isoform X1 n=1 Tax=Tachypleus tridentatus TaxID=6853 RepID=UPI003FD594B0
MWITSPDLKLSTPTTIGRKYHVYEVLLLVIAALRTVYPAVPTYQAVVGQSAQIPCNISLPSEVDSISLVLWYKSGISAPIFSVDSRKGPLEESKHFTSDVLGQRGYFDISTQPSVLTINPIQKDDEGDYRCRIDFRYGRTFNSIVTLNVIVPPEEVIIVDETGEQIYGYIGPYNEGSKLVLGCIAKAGKPPPYVTWWKNSVLLDSTFQDNGDRGVRNDYILQKLTREDLMAQLTCRASNTKLITPEVASVIIDMNLNPVEIRIISTHRHFAAGRQFGIECQTTGSRPSCYISWWLGTRRMEAAVETVGDDGNQTLSNLVFTPSSEDNGKYLSCRAENPRLPGRALEHGITLNVYYKPKVSVILGHGQVTERIQTGDDVYLHCQYNSNPEVTRIEWQYQRGTLISNSRAGVFVRNQTLVLKNVRMEQSGTYRCLADNEEGKGESEELELNIKYVPVCKKGQKIAYAVTVNELVKVSCEVNADPDDVTFTWSVNNTEGSQELLSFDSSGLRSVARYIPRNKNDFGFLTCKGRNTVGEQIEPCIFTLIAVGPPSPQITVIYRTQRILRYSSNVPMVMMEDYSNAFM